MTPLQIFIIVLAWLTSMFFLYNIQNKNYLTISLKGVRDQTTLDVRRVSRGRMNDLIIHTMTYDHKEVRYVIEDGPNATQLEKKLEKGFFQFRNDGEGVFALKLEAPKNLAQNDHPSG